MVTICRWIAALGLAAVIAGACGVYFSRRRWAYLVAGIGIGLVVGPGVYLLFTV